MARQAIIGQDDIVVPYVARLLGVPDLGPAVGIGFARDDRLIGGIAYHNWSPAYQSVEASIATDDPHWAVPSIIRLILWYPFVAIGAQRLQATIRKRNRRSQRFVRKLGFEYEGKGRRAFGDDDACVYSMLVEEWQASKWHVEVDDGQGRRRQRANG